MSGSKSEQGSIKRYRNGSLRNDFLGEAAHELQSEELIALLRVSDAMARSESLDDVLHHVVSCAAKLTNADYVSIGLLEKQQLQFRVQVGLHSDWSRDVPIDRGITGWVARHKRTQNVANVLQDPRFLRPSTKSRVVSEMAVPIVAEGQVLGVIDVASSKPGPFTRRYQTLLEELSKRAAVAITNAGRAEQTNGRLVAEIRTLQRLQDVDIKLAERLLNVEDVLETILSLAVSDISADAGQFLLFDHDALVISKEFGAPVTSIGTRLSLSGPGITIKAFQSKKPIIVDDVKSHKWNTLYVATIPGMRSELAIPIVAGDNCFGVLNLEASHPSLFKDFHVEMGCRLAQRASIAIGMARKIDRLHKVGLVAAGAQTTNLADILDAIYDGVQELFPGTDAAVFLRSLEDPRIFTYAPGTKHVPKDSWNAVRVVTVGRGVVGRAVQDRHTNYVPNISQVTDTDAYVELISTSQSSLGIPLTNPRGDVIGGFVIESALPNAFSSSDIQLLELFAGFASTALSNHAFIKELESAWKAIELSSQQAVANASLTALGEITGNLIHRIGNDIGVAHEELKDLLAETRVPDVRRALLTAKRNTAGVLTLTNHLLARINDIGYLAIGDLNLHDAVDQAISDAKPLVRSVKITNDVASLPSVRSTQVLPLVISELIRNALKAIGRKRGSIIINGAVSGDTVTLFILNSGAPIPEQSQPYIFNFLFQAGPMGRGSGIGFGLWWARAVLRAQGGDITLRSSTRQGGTMFQLTFRRSTHLE